LQFFASIDPELTFGKSSVGPETGNSPKQEDKQSVVANRGSDVSPFLIVKQPETSPNRRAQPLHSFQPKSKLIQPS